VQLCHAFCLQFKDLVRRIGLSPRFVSGVDEAQNQQKRSESFAKRNEGLRIAGPKSLKSLGALNQGFRGFVCFQTLKFIFVSPFSQHALSRPKRAEIWRSTRPSVMPRKLASSAAVRHLDSRLRGNDKLPLCDSRERILAGGTVRTCMSRV
jgi:hypothetical protein